MPHYLVDGCLPLAVVRFSGCRFEHCRRFHPRARRWALGTVVAYSANEKRNHRRQVGWRVVWHWLLFAVVVAILDSLCLCLARCRHSDNSCPNTERHLAGGQYWTLFFSIMP